MLDAVCTHVTSSAASRENAMTLTTGSYQFWVAHSNLQVTFQSLIRFARKMRKNGDAFSKSSRILEICNKFKPNRKKLSSIDMFVNVHLFFPMTLWSSNAALFKRVAEPTKVDGNDQFTIPQDNAYPAALYFSFQFI